MFGNLARKMFGSANARIVKGYQARVQSINALEPQMQALDDASLAGKTQEFRARLARGESLDGLLPEAFAVVREASKRVMRMRHFDVQLIGGMVLHAGRIAEMRTGEGKTLVATLAVYLNALPGKGVHVVTVNDYLARRDSEWMGQLYRFLGLSVGAITHDMDDFERQAAYACDITYATNNELGFDYLRDNMKYARQTFVQRPFHFAVVDEVDSILIDEARTPLIISGPTEDNSTLYTIINAYIPRLHAEDYEKDEKARSATLTEAGMVHMEAMLLANGMIAEGESLYDVAHISLVHHVNQALRAHVLFTRDVDYIVKDDKVVIIDEFTGRMMDGRRYSDGLHQALEAKENVHIQNENQTLASITFQNYFRLYPKLSGMTGTAMTEATEFADIYRLEVVDIPTNLPVARVDADDVIYRTIKEKDQAILDLIRECHNRMQPVLVGTVSIDRSEQLSALLKRANIPHKVLNARYHEQEAQIVAQAGRPGAVTIATNMAGRGTDIKLGGNEEMMLEEAGEAANKDEIITQIQAARKQVVEAGGLYVIGTERHESRRIDNQLRGRAGRQGDPGASQFFLSLEDDLMRIFGGARMDTMLQRFGIKEGEAITHPWMNKAIERAQTKVEQRNYDIRKNLLKFDNVMNDQRKVVYEQRGELMDTDEALEIIHEMREDVNKGLLAEHIPERSYPEQWELESLHTKLLSIYGVDIPVQAWAHEEGIGPDQIAMQLDDATRALLEEKTAEYSESVMQMASRRILMQTLDQLWKEHLLGLDHLRGGINLRAYGQKDPLNEYKQEAFLMFDAMLTRLREMAVMRVSHLVVRVESSPEELTAPPPQRMQETRIDPALRQALTPNFVDEHMQPRLVPSSRVDPTMRDPNNPATWGKVSRNELCPCGSGEKYKYCHGKTA